MENNKKISLKLSVFVTGLTILVSACTIDINLDPSEQEKIENIIKEVSSGEVLPSDLDEEVTKPTGITVLSPKPGQRYIEGSTYYIKWEAPSVELVNIEARMSGRDMGHIAGKIPSELGTYKWVIPKGYISGFGLDKSDEMFIRVTSTDDHTVYDENDEPFSILDPNTYGYTDLYEDADAGFRINLPTDIKVNAFHGDDSSSLVLYANAVKIDELKGHLGNTPEFGYADKESLENGELLQKAPFSLEDSNSVIPLGNGKYGRTYSTLAQFEVCSVMFKCSLIFYNRGYQITLTIDGPTKLREEDGMEKYIGTNPENCGDDLVWNHQESGKENFYNDLVTGNAPTLTQKWHDMLNEIVSNLEIVD